MEKDKKKTGMLYKGYEIGKNPAKWILEKEEQLAQQIDAEANAEVDQLDEDGEKKSKSKKRKAGETKSSKKKSKVSKDDDDDTAPKKKRVARKRKAGEDSEEEEEKKETRTSKRVKEEDDGQFLSSSSMTPFTFISSGKRPRGHKDQRMAAPAPTSVPSG